MISAFISDIKRLVEVTPTQDCVDQIIYAKVYDHEGLFVKDANQVLVEPEKSRIDVLALNEADEAVEITLKVYGKNVNEDTYTDVVLEEVILVEPADPEEPEAEEIFEEFEISSHSDFKAEVTVDPDFIDDVTILSKSLSINDRDFDPDGVVVGGEAGEKIVVPCDFRGIYPGDDYSIVFEAENIGVIGRDKLILFHRDGYRLELSELEKEREQEALAATEQARNEAEQHAENAGESEEAAIEAQAASELARDESVTAKEASETARDVSVTAKEASETARDVSVTAKEASESARDISITAKEESEAARDESADSAAAAAVSETNAGNSETAAITAQGISETARDESVTAKEESETARDISVTAKNDSETARDGSVAAKEESGSARDKAKRWADEEEDIEVETGKYSSNHHATKAAASALKLDGLEWKNRVISILSDPPADPGNGDRHIVGENATGDWTGQEDKIAEWDSSEWIFSINPHSGWFTHVIEENDLFRFRDGAWDRFTSSQIPVTVNINDGHSPYAIPLGTTKIICDTTDGDIEIHLPNTNSMIETEEEQTIHIIKADWSPNSIFVKPANASDDTIADMIQFLIWGCQKKVSFIPSTNRWSV